ncbi:GNAT family N-acetyltransferase [Flexithrix dorotheae]|uniref:GNAT family N-acetyltransferase n=1 Tax=Flexithrix dorotheae TaxID=70993 RepID=UPI0003716633|nr:GNAT family N-acetyltransferase [Flexithrix dorotheae]
MIKFHKVSEDSQIQEFAKSFYHSLTFPLDGMWEAFFSYSEKHFIFYGNSKAGFLMLNSDNQLINFYLLPEFAVHSEQILKRALFIFNIQYGLAGTNNPLFLSACLDYLQDIRTHTFLFKNLETSKEPLAPVPNTQTRNITLSRLDLITSFCKMNTGAPEEWLYGYLKNLVERKELFCIERNGIPLATFEVRKSDSQPGIADLGMIVDKQQRGKGLGTFALKNAKKVALENGLTPICSCEAENIASRKAIEKAGFFNVHRILQFRYV